MIVDQKKRLAHTVRLFNYVQRTHVPSSMSALLVSCRFGRVQSILIIVGLNINADKEAAEHFLSALSLQESSGITSETSDSLWSTLRKALHGMVCCLKILLFQYSFIFQDRADLANFAKPENRGNLDIFREEGFDF